MVTKGQIMGWLLSPLSLAISNFCCVALTRINIAVRNHSIWSNFSVTKQFNLWNWEDHWAIFIINLWWTCLNCCNVVLFQGNGYIKWMKPAKEVEANEVWNFEHSCVRVKGWEGGRGSWSEDSRGSSHAVSLFMESIRWQHCILILRCGCWSTVKMDSTQKLSIATKDPHIEWSSDQTQLWKQETSGAWSLLVNSEGRL